MSSFSSPESPESVPASQDSMPESVVVPDVAAWHAHPLWGLFAGIAAVLTVWGCLEPVYPVFRPVVAQSRAIATGPPSAEEIAKYATSEAAASRSNLLLLLVLCGIGTVVGLMVSESAARGRVESIPVLAPFALLITAIGCVSACFLGEAVFGWLRSSRSFAPIPQTIVVQTSSMAVIGAAIGLAFGVAYRKAALLFNSVTGGAVGGAVGAAIYPIVAGLVVPIARTESLIPNLPLSRLIWLVLPFGLMGLFILSLGKTRPKKRKPVEETT